MSEVLEWLKILYIVYSKQEIAAVGFYNQGFNPWFAGLILSAMAYAELAAVYLVLRWRLVKKIHFPKKVVIFWGLLYDWLEIGLKALRQWESFRNWERVILSYQQEERTRRERHITRLITWLSRLGYTGLAFFSLMPLPMVGVFLIIAAVMAGIRHAYLLIGAGSLVKIALLIYLVYHHGDKIVFLQKFDFGRMFWLLILSYILYLTIGLFRHIVIRGGINNFRD